MKLKSILISSIAFITSLSGFAQKQKIVLDIKESDVCMIEYVNTDTGYIKVGNNEIKTKGQCFYAGQTIHWHSDKHSVKVRNMRTGEILRFCAKEFTNEIHNITSWYIKKNRIYDKGGISMNDILANTFYMIDDTVSIKSKLPMDDNHGYIVSTIPGNIKFILPYDSDTNEIVISRLLLKNYNIYIEKAPMRFHVEYWKCDKPEALSDNMKIEYIPEIAK